MAAKVQSDVGKAEGFLNDLLIRRSHYQINNEAVVPDAQVENIITEIVYHTPSSFNSQTTRVLLLFNDDHVKLWEITKKALESVLPADQLESNQRRVDGFQAGHGTVLFFEDEDAVKQMQEKLAFFADRFPNWAEHTSAMHQYAAWVALRHVGYGGNLQHYNPWIDEQVQKEWDISPRWTLKAQLVFGKPTGELKDKSFEPIEKRLKVAGKK